VRWGESGNGQAWGIQLHPTPRRSPTRCRGAGRPGPGAMRRAAARQPRAELKGSVMADVEWDKVTMPCPKCGRVMKARQNKENGSRFMGCTGWPIECQATAPIPAYVILKTQGAQSLPGFD